MNTISHHNFYSFLFFFLLLFACKKEVEAESIVTINDRPGTTFKLPNIDLTHWKVTLPIGNPTSIKPPEILGYATNDVLKPYMYNDSIEGALVFYTKPGTSTPNSSYSRTELREQMVSGSDYVNWTFKQGARIKGRLRLDEISNDSSGNPYRTIVMQIHGRLTDTQRDLLGQKDNNAPPIMKIYWANGYVRLKSKVLKNPNAVEPEILHTSAWGDDDGYTFPVEVGYDPFTLEIIASEGRMEVILNDTYSRVYQGTDMEKWSVFENYFKAGNYFQTKDENAFSRLKYYMLEVMH